MSQACLSEALRDHARARPSQAAGAIAETRRTRYPGSPDAAAPAAPAVPIHWSETTMVSYAELFDIGEDFRAFVGRGLAAEQGAVARIRQKLEADALSDASRERLRRIDKRYRLLAAGEMWCPDCQINLAALDFMQRLQPNLELAIISRGRAEDALRERLGLERVSIPLVLVLDEEFHPLGRFVERPQAVLAGGPEALPAYKAGDYLDSTVDEILAIIENPAAGD